MGFMSLVFMGIYLIIMIAGAIDLLIAVIIFLVRFIKKRRKKRVGRVSKVVAIIFLIMGTLAEMPLIIAMVQLGIEEANEKRNYESLENKVLVETDYLEDEFEYNGETLVRVDEVENDSYFYRYDEQKTEFVANLIFNTSDEDYYYVELRKVENASGCDIYIVFDSNYLYYVKKEDKEKMIEYYQSEAECIAEVQRDSDDWVEVEIDLQKIQHIIANSETEDKRACSEEKVYYDLEVYSVDYVWGAHYSFAFFEDCAFFEPITNDNDTVIKGYLMSEEDAAYLREVFDNAITENS